MDADLLIVAPYSDGLTFSSERQTINVDPLIAPAQPGGVTMSSRRQTLRFDAQTGNTPAPSPAPSDAGAAPRILLTRTLNVAGLEHAIRPGVT